MSFSVRGITPRTHVIAVGKALDYRNAQEFKNLIDALLQAGVLNLILDFSNTGILDSTGLGAIFSAYRKITPRGGHIVFANLSRPVQMVIELTHTNRIFKIFPTVEAAQAALMPAKAS
ncbi:MAG: STAS domain-containing protein [Bacteroidetes bacterium]|nr:STAS domain-containing protein [Rhodothermia bacterium]MCS7155286.1 STAS domain-containing protein [Bacteroidota bacterium]MCX7907871.1 STAS domain-containing protein [Bacteroidota bacterium]MDW8138690.1 STAS domain-containing protein [Bacteroidota bacterium]MDW8284724.1 STAS domain-containing protein [Bacteroidota bacterium]